MLALFSILVAAACVLAYVRLAPIGADALRKQRFDRWSLGLLAALFAFVGTVVTLCIGSSDAVLLAMTMFALAFVPLYLGAAGLLRSRLYSNYHHGGRASL